MKGVSPPLPKEPDLDVRRANRRWRIAALAAVWTVLGTLGAVLVFEWHEQDLWQSSKRQAIESGRLPAWESMIPPPVDDAENFAMLPQLEPLRTYLSLPRARRDDHWKTPALFGGIHSFGEAASETLRINQANGQRLDLNDLYKALVARGCVNAGPDPASAILRALEPHQAMLQEITTAAACRASRLPFQYENGLDQGTISYGSFKDLGYTLAARSCARRSAGLFYESASDIISLLRVARALQRDPILACVLTGQVYQRLAANLIWDGMVDHQWTAQCLRDLRIELDQAEPLFSFNRAYTMEALAWIRITESYLRGDKPTWGALSEADPATVMASQNMWIRWSTHYLLRRALPVLCDRTADFHSIVRLKDSVFDVMRYDAWREEIDHSRVPSSFVGWGHYDANQVDRLVFRTLHDTVLLCFALLACQLDEEYLKTGRYPGQLDARGRNSIDTMGGGQLDYVVAVDGSAYQISSRGWKRVEDSYADDTAAPEWIHDWRWTIPQRLPVD